MKTLLTLFFAILLLFSCEETTVLGSGDATGRISLTVTGLNAPGDSAWYEAWISWDELEGGNNVRKYASLGILAGSASLYSLETAVEIGGLQRAKEVIITIEPDDVPGMRFTGAGDTLFTPTAFSVIGSTIEANNSVFTIGSQQLLNFDFSTLQGSFLLYTPTSPASANNFAGLWFATLDTTMSTDTTGSVVIDSTFSEALMLPELTNGWVYEGLVIKGGDTLSTGKFTSPVGADMSFAYSGSRRSAITTFPGEDFINNAPAGLTFPLSLVGAEVQIRLTPTYPAYANRPFRLTLMRATIGQNPVLFEDNMLESDPSSFPGGDLTIRINVYE